ncbi:tetratricopeptide repeat protein [Candidatus Electrothrix sp.]|uniref:tetratricopeptide repeat protein n=1 Tax=Candidatus Electrothrix sp. TaxID=2170559 RepID=UPI0040571D16
MSRRNSRNRLNSRESSTHIQTVEEYSRKLELLEDGSEGLLAVLLLRDQLQNAISSEGSYPDDELQRLVRLDKQLKSIVLKTESIKNLSEYRRTFFPAEEYWWWYIDQEASAQEEKKDLLWNVGTVLLVTASSAFTMEIIKRLWVGTPDTISFFGSAVSLALTSSAFTKQGREIGEKLLEKIPQLQRTAHAEAKFATSVIAAFLVFAIWLYGVPKLAVYYNNNAMKLKNNHMPTQAQYYFQRAAALAPEKAPPCYELGRLYEHAGQIDKATVWYEKALERDLNFLGSYNACGRMYILKKKYDSAILILRAGLRIAKKSSKDSMESDIIMLYRYRLLQNLGWTYYAHEQYKLAQEVLEQAVALEKDVTHPVSIDAPVHYFLASALDKLGNKKMACEHWEIALRYPADSGFLYQEGWQKMIKERNQNCDQGGWQ